MALREDIEDKNNAGTLSNIEHCMLDRVKKQKNYGEANYVIENMADRRDEEEELKMTIDIR